MGAAASVVKHVDENENKVCDVDMFAESSHCVRDLVMVLQENEGTQEKKLEKAFSEMDTDDNATVDAKEFVEFVKSRYPFHDDDTVRNALRSMDTNSDGRITLIDLRSHAKREGLFVSRILSTFRPTESQICESARIVLDEFKKLHEWLCQDMKQNPPSRSFDEETVQMMREGQIDETKIDGNSNCFWDQNAELKTFRDSILKRFLEACGQYEPNETQKKCAKHVVLGWLVRRMFICRKDRNMGAVVLKDMYDECGRPIVLFRSPVMTYSGSCFRDLLTHGRVRTVHSVYAGTFPIYDWIEMEIRESKVKAQPSCLYFDERTKRKPRKWRRLVDDYDKSPEHVKRNAMILCARQIVEILRSCANGNVLVHCAGGMHRTGMLVGIIRRYINKDPIELVVEDYKRHVAFESSERPGGYEESNVRFIRNFDLDILDQMMRGQVVKLESDMVDDEDLQVYGRDEWGMIVGRRRHRRVVVD